MAKISENKISPQLGLRKEINASLEEVSAKFVVSNVEQMSSAQISELKAGDIVLKEDSSGKHSYIVSYKKDGTGICLTYTDASCVETVSYDFTGGQWVFNSKDVTLFENFETEEQINEKLEDYAEKTNFNTLSGKPIYNEQPTNIQALVSGDGFIDFRGNGVIDDIDVVPQTEEGLYQYAQKLAYVNIRYHNDGSGNDSFAVGYLSSLYNDVEHGYVVFEITTSLVVVDTNNTKQVISYITFDLGRENSNWVCGNFTLNDLTDSFGAISDSDILSIDL